MPINSAQFSNLVDIYQKEIDSLVLNLGKNVTLYFAPTVSEVNERFDDPVRGGTRRPSFDETQMQPQPTVVENTRTIKALIKNTPGDFERYGIKINNPQGIIRLKTFLTDVPDLNRCDYIIPNVDIRGVIDVKYRMLRAPVPVGLQEDRYAISYWEVV